MCSYVLALGMGLNTALTVVVHLWTVGVVLERLLVMSVGRLMLYLPVHSGALMGGPMIKVLVRPGGGPIMLWLLQLQSTTLRGPMKPIVTNYGRLVLTVGVPPCS